MSSNEQAENATATRRSRRLVARSSSSCGGGSGGMTNTRPKQQTSATTTNEITSSDNNFISGQNNVSTILINNNNDGELDDESAAAATKTTLTSITTTIEAAPSPSSSSVSTMQSKTRSKIVRRTTEPKEEDIRLVRMVKLYPFLYDRTDLSYGKKKSSEQTWEIISQAMSQPVPTCKDRWRNIRAAYMRSIDCYKTQNGPNRSKEYYLKHELTFLRECAEKQKAKGIVPIHDSSSNDADSDLGTSSSLTSVIDNTQNLNETHETQAAQPRLIPRPTSQLIETPTTSHNQHQLTSLSIEPTTRVTISAAAPTSHCNGFQSTVLSRHSTSQLPANTVPIPIQLPIQFPLQLPLTAASAAASSSSISSTNAVNSFQRSKIFTLTEQHERTNNDATTTSASTSTSTNSCADSANPPAKRRRYYEYDEKNDIFKRIQFLNIFDKWSEDDSDALFVKSLYLKMRNLNEDQSLRFQCMALNALREVQSSNSNNNNNNTMNLTPKSTPTSTSTNSSSGSLATPNTSSTPNSNSMLRLDHLNEEQRLQIQQFAQQVAASASSNDASNTARSSLHAMMNGHSENGGNGSLGGGGVGTLTLRRADLSNIVMPLLIKNEPFDSGHLSN